MNSLLTVFLYMQKPELLNLNAVKNYRIHFNTLYLRHKLTPIFGSTLTFPYIVQRTFRCNKSGYADLLKTDKFVKKMKFYYSNYDKKPSDIFTIKAQPVKLEAHMDLLTTTLHKSGVRVLILDDCNLNDFFFSKICWTDFKDLIDLKLNDNHLTNHSVKHLSKMNFSKNFENLEINLNNLDEDALRIIFNSENFKYLVNLSIHLKENRKRKEKVPYSEISKLPKLYIIKCNRDAFSYEIDLETDQAKKLGNFNSLK